ncbi:ABC transporter ATP-binding protein [Exiguobacterium oxidotolerans]|uniref:Uncharacterized ABC transporter ATP-binding protein YhcH n=1 Tax=Exiguobacterium oxidotolerans TaxID=223958 RepID=A0A653IHI0_9BACL|nr:ABC transporter ATP-binding protein [Exiguobacterium oxidotolerans]VWX38602.1 Uncharacterized ABC transporter ATP-binding protein YhcH [Exiguobacterium oxidotolerans]
MVKNSVLEVKKLCKEIDGKKIINDLSFSVEKGQVFGFLGPNGSGKTTTIRMMTGMIKPTSGSVKIMGHDVQTNFYDAMKNMGAIVEHPALFDYLSGWKNLIQSVRLTGEKHDESYLKWCVETVELSDRIHDKVKSYSLGMKQRLAIAQSLISSPKILVLDEPTNGMDPSGIKDMRSLIKKLSVEYGITIFISSHLLSEIENLCDHVLIINKGTEVVNGSVRSLLEQNQPEFNFSIDPAKINQAVLLLTEKNIKCSQSEDQIVVHTTRSDIPHLVNYLYEHQVFVYSITKSDNSLEDYFISVTREVG